MKDDNYYSLFPDQRPHYSIDPLDKIRENVKILCSSLKRDYVRETKRFSSRMIKLNIDVEKHEQNLKEIENDEVNFIIDEGNKYYKVVQIFPDNKSKVHCFVDIDSGDVYKPQSSTSASKKVFFNLEKCIKICDWRGYYLKDVPDY